MTKLASCKDCGHQVSKSAKTCPQCGVAKPATQPAAIKDQVISAIVLLVLVVVMVFSCSDDPLTWDDRVATPLGKVKAMSASKKRAVVNSYLSGNNIAADQTDPFYRCLSEFSHTKSETLLLGKVMGWCNNDYQRDAAKFVTQYHDIDAALQFFSPYSGAYLPLETQIKSGMHNPDSYDHVKTTYRLVLDGENPHMVINTVFRGANMLGATVTDNREATIPLTTGKPVVVKTPATDPAEEAANAAAVPVVNDTNIGAVMAELQTDYQQLVTSLLTQYKVAAETGNTTGFINWRKQQWLPEKTAISDKYDSIVEKNRPWFGLKDETRATSVIGNLELVSLDLLYSLQRNDKTKLKAARDKIVEMNQLLASVQTAAQ